MNPRRCRMFRKSCRMSNPSFLRGPNPKSSNSSRIWRWFLLLSLVVLVRLKVGLLVGDDALLVRSSGISNQMRLYNCMMLADFWGGWRGEKKGIFVLGLTDVIRTFSLVRIIKLGFSYTITQIITSTQDICVALPYRYAIFTTEIKERIKDVRRAIPSVTSGLAQAIIDDRFAVDMVEAFCVLPIPSFYHGNHKAFALGLYPV